MSFTLQNANQFLMFDLIMMILTLLVLLMLQQVMISIAVPVLGPCVAHSCLLGQLVWTQCINDLTLHC